MATMTHDHRFPCRLFPHDDGDGPANMARDEALLDLVAEEPGAAVFRTYGWTVPTLSLGYFQTTAEMQSDPRWRAVPVVRRPTGGGAIWHDREITYALAIPVGSALARKSDALYQAVHHGIAALLRDFGVAASPRGETGAGAPGSRPFLCFRDRDRADIVVGDVKLVGSAQRRRAGAILQHGSILLERSPITPELPGAADLSPVPVEALVWADLLRRALPESRGFRSRSEAWPRAFLTHVRELEAAVYRNPAWLARR